MVFESKEYIISWFYAIVVTLNYRDNGHSCSQFDAWILKYGFKLFHSVPLNPYRTGRTYMLYVHPWLRDWKDIYVICPSLVKGLEGHICYMSIPG